MISQIQNITKLLLENSITKEVADEMLLKLEWQPLFYFQVKIYQPHRGETKFFYVKGRTWLEAKGEYLILNPKETSFELVKQLKD